MTAWVLLALLAAPSSPQALVGGVAGSEEEAQKWLDGLQRSALAEPAAGAVRFAAGYPQVISGAEIPSLDAAKFAVVLGVCAAAEIKTRLAMLKVFTPAVSVRAAKPAATLGCPTISVKPFEDNYTTKRTLKSEGVSASMYLSSGRVAVVLQEGDRVLDVWTPPVLGKGGRFSGCSPSPKKEDQPGLMVVEQACAWSPKPRCETTYASAFTVGMAVKEKKLTIAQGQVLENASTCAEK